MMKQAKLAAQTCLPDDARPPATPTRFDSAMPTLKKRSGNFLAKCSVRVELWTSPSTTTICGCSAPTCARARPKASRVDLPILGVDIFSISSDTEHLQRRGRLGLRQRLAVVVGVLAEQALDGPALD